MKRLLPGRKRLISHRFDSELAEPACNHGGGAEASLGILLQYPGIELTPAALTVALPRQAAASAIQDRVALQLSFGNGLNGTVHGMATASKSLQHERPQACAPGFLQAVTSSGTAPIAADEEFEFRRLTINIAEAAR